MSQPSINFLHLTVSVLQSGQDYCSHRPAYLPVNILSNPLHPGKVVKL